MKAAVIRGIKEIAMEEVETPQVGPSDVLVKVRVCGICGSDLHYYEQGLYPEVAISGGSGKIPGHEYVGDVVGVGSQVENLKVGERIITIGAFGAMAEYIKLGPETPAIQHGLVFRVPPEMSDEEAATIEPLCVGLAGMEKGNPADGDVAVVMGVGPIGLGLVQCLKALFDLKVIVVGRQSEVRLAAAEKAGADMIVRSSEVDPFEKLLELTGSIPVWGYYKPAANVDIVYDCAGHSASHAGPSACQQGLWMLRPENGRVVLVAAYQGTVELDLMAVVQKQLKIMGSLNTPPDLVERAMELVRSKKVDRGLTISHEFPLEKIKEAFDTQADTRKSLKVLIRP